MEANYHPAITSLHGVLAEGARKFESGGSCRHPSPHLRQSTRAPSQRTTKTFEKDADKIMAYAFQAGRWVGKLRTELMENFDLTVVVKAAREGKR